MIHKIKDFIKSKIFNVEGYSDVSTPNDINVYFILEYGALSIGKLWLENGEWHYIYTEEFKRQNKLIPIVDFPEIEKHYKSNDLWPFFALRIPSLAQPKVMSLINEKKLSINDMSILLKEFAQKTIANPFVLRISTE